MRPKPTPVELEAPPTIDEEMQGEHTTIDGAPQQNFMPLPERGPGVDGRWEESTVAEKSSSKKGLAPLDPDEHAIAAGSAPGTTLPPATPASNDSARVLVDFDDSRVGGPTNVDDNALMNMPTAISPNALVAQGRQAGAGAAAIGRLVVIGGNDRGREFVLTARETTLGRGADNDIILTDIAVSRHHITLYNDGNRHGVRDMSSGNGTLINGVRIVGDVFVHDGDQLELGNTLIRFEHPDAGSSVTTPPMLPPSGAAGVVVGAALAPPHGMGGGSSAGVTGMPGVPGLPGVPPPGPPLGPPGMLGSGLPLPPGPPQAIFAPAGGAVPPPHPQPMPVPQLGSMHASGFVPVPPMLGPQNPSPRAMDLLKGQRNLLLYMGAGVAGFALLVFVAVKLSGGSDKQHAAVSTEASTSPALNALLADVDRPATPPTPPVPVPHVAKPPVVAPTPPPVVKKDPPVTPPAPAPDPKVASLEPRTPPPAPVPVPVAPVVEKKPPPPKKGPPPRVVAKRPPPPPAPKEPKNPAAAAERAAATLYKNKEWVRASDTLHTAAGKETGEGADRLEAMAKDYTQVGIAIAKGDGAAVSNPVAAMAAYKQAYMLDARSGKGAHGVYLKAQLGKVAPKAALALVGSGKFEAARAACDDAAQYGAGDDATVGKVRSILEIKAKELYGQGTAMSKSKPDEAKALWRRVLKMVPAESPWYTKAYAALNKSMKTASQDEDE